jgi:mRNA interferase YafQ
MLKREKNQKKFTEVLEFLACEKELPFKHRDHKLSGDYIGSRELHIEPDWLLISAELILERTGSHSDLFKK